MLVEPLFKEEVSFIVAGMTFVLRDIPERPVDTHFSDIAAMVVAFEHLARYGNSAEVAFERWDVSRERLREFQLLGDTTIDQTLAELHLRSAGLAELHFYPTSWTMIKRHIERLKKRTCTLRIRSVAQSWKRHRKILEDHTSIRDHFEHVDERLPGAANGMDAVFYRLEAPNRQLGWWVNDSNTLTIDGITIQVDRDGLKALADIISDVRASFIEEMKSSIERDGRDSLQLVEAILNRE